MVGDSHRLNRIKLVQRRADELERHARRRYSVTPSGPSVLNGSASAEQDIAKQQRVLEECLQSFKVMIADIVSSSCSDVQLQQVAKILEDVALIESLSNTFTRLVYEVVSVTRIDVLAYTAMFASDMALYNARSMQLAARMGLRFNNMVRVERKNDVQELEEMERQLDLFLQAPNKPPSSSLLRAFRLKKYFSSGSRPDLVSTIRTSLPAETRIIFEPLLLQFMDEYVTRLHAYGELKPLFDDASIRRLMHFLEIQIDGFLCVIHRGESLISLANFISSQVDRCSHHQDLRFLTVRMSYEFAKQFGVDILANRRDLSKDRITLLTHLIAAYVDLGPGFIPPYSSHLESMPDERLSVMVRKLSKIVSWREAYLSRNQDPPLGLDMADEWHQAMMQPDYEYGNMESYLNMMSDCEFPDRITDFSQRLMSLYRQYGRTSFGRTCENAATYLPATLMRLEIESGVVYAKDSKSLLLGEYLESVFIDMLDLLELASLKSDVTPSRSYDYSSIIFGFLYLKLAYYLDTNLQDSDSVGAQREDAQSQETRSSLLEDADYLFVNLSENDGSESLVESRFDDLSILAHNEEEGCGVDLTGLSSSRDEKMKKVDFADLYAQLSALSARIQHERQALFE